MPVSERWIKNQVVSITWTAPLTSGEVSYCFVQLARKVQVAEQMVHILFDITDAGSIPTQAPMHFIKSQIALQPQLGSIAVVGINPIAQILAQMAAKMTGQTIVFFDDTSAALDYIHST